MNTFPLGRPFTEALVWVAKLHAGQYRKGSQIPYLSHVLGVASIALEFGATEAEGVAALLHDALEDGPANTGKDATVLRQELEARFGPEVARLVDGATDDMPAAGAEKAPWVTRKLEYLRRLSHEDSSSLLVSAADKLHNARSILSDVLALETAARPAYFDRFRQGMEGTLQYYRLLTDTYRTAPAVASRPRLGELVSELERTVGALEAACGLTPEQVRQLPLLREY